MFNNINDKFRIVMGKEKIRRKKKKVKEIKPKKEKVNKIGCDLTTDFMINPDTVYILQND